MYTPLSEEFMFAETRDRVARLRASRTPTTGGDNRRWWRPSTGTAGRRAR